MATGKQREALINTSIDALGFGPLDESVQERLQLLVDAVLLPGLATVRQIKRYFATVRSLLPGVIVEGHRNVDPADFLALEYIRQNAPDLYEVIRNEEEPHPGGRVDQIAFHEEFAKSGEERRRGAISRLDTRQAALVSKALSTFKRNSSDRGFRGSSSSTEHIERRFSSRHSREVYLGFQAGWASLPEHEWKRFLKGLKSGNTPTGLVGILDRQETRLAWAQLITDRTREIPGTARSTILSELLSWAERQTRSSEWPSVVYLIASACLAQVRDSQSAVSILTEACEKAGAIVSPAFLVGMEINRLRRNEHGEWCELSHIDPLAQSMLTSIRALVKSGQIWEVPDTYDAIIAWKYLAGLHEVEEWQEALVEDHGQLVKFLNLYLGSGQNLDQTEWMVEPHDAILRAIKGLDPEQLTEAGQWARTKYIRAAVRTANGFRDLEAEEGTD